VQINKLGHGDAVRITPRQGVDQGICVAISPLGHHLLSLFEVGGENTAVGRIHAGVVEHQVEGPSRVGEPQCGNVNSNWPHRVYLKWPYLRS
jgi:hypothetical protein